MNLHLTKLIVFFVLTKVAEGGLFGRKKLQIIYYFQTVNLTIFQRTFRLEKLSKKWEIQWKSCVLLTLTTEIQKSNFGVKMIKKLRKNMLK